MFSITEQKITYSTSLLLSIPERKTFEALARQAKISGDSMARLLEENPVAMQDLAKIAESTLDKRLIWYLIIDDSLLLKLYSIMIGGTCDNYDSSDKRTRKSLCPVVAMISDGFRSIPLTFGIWIAEEIAKNKYLKKWEIAKMIIQEARETIRIDKVLADGLYCVVDFLLWLHQENFKFDMRIHANRVLTFKDEVISIKKAKQLLLKGKNNMRSALAMWHGVSYHFTALRRLLRNGTFTTVYQISNYQAPSKVHVRAYQCRWEIEKFFRTAKQRLGFGDCQSRKFELQKKHIENVFFAYATLQYEASCRSFKNIESLLNTIKQCDFNEVLSRMSALAQIFGVA